MSESENNCRSKKCELGGKVRGGDLLQWYNNLDVKSSLEGLDEQCEGRNMDQHLKAGRTVATRSNNTVALSVTEMQQYFPG